MTKILITGCAGLLGNNFSRHLLDKGHEVIGLDNLSGGYKDLMDPRMSFFEVDITKSSQVDGIFRYKRPDYVYHFAAYAAVGLSPFIRNFNYTTNVVGSANVINSCLNHDVKKIVFTSSMDVYGSQISPFDETMRPRPEDPYGIAKYTVEQDLEAASRLFGLRYSIVRPHNVFGVYQNIWDKYRNVLGIWIRQTLNDQPITIYGDGSQVRSFSDVKYYMQPFEMLMNDGDGEVYNMGADQHTTIIDAARRFRIIANMLGKGVDIVHLAPRDEVKVAYCDHTKAKQQLGFRDDTDFSDLVTNMFTWARSQPNRQVKTMKYEVEQKLYDFWK